MAVRPPCIALEQRHASAASDPSRLASIVSTKTASPCTPRTRPFLSARSELSPVLPSQPRPPVLSRSAPSVIASAVASSRPCLDPPMEESANFADILGTISSLQTEVGAEWRAADECMRRSAEDSGRSTEDYERRAQLFECSGKMVASSKLKGERIRMEMELLVGEVLERDEGRSAEDYLRRAQIFSKSAEVFARQQSDEAKP